MSKKWLDLFLLTAGSIAVLFLNLGNSRFWDQDEGYYASVSYEMFRRGDWIVPTFNDQLFAHKPPMMYWGMLLAFQVAGVSEFAARLPSAIMGWGCSLLVYLLGERLFDRRTGLIAGSVMLSCLMFTVVARSATADAHLTFFVLLAIFLWARDAFPKSLHRNGQSEELSIRWPTWIGVYSAMGMAVLCKGPIGFAFPATIMASVHLIDPHLRDLATIAGKPTWKRIVNAIASLRPIESAMILWRMRPLTAFTVGALVVGPWLLAVQWQTSGAFWNEFIGVHHLQRFSQAMDNHGGPFYYYPLACLIGLYPWSAFAIPTCLHWFSRPTRTNRERQWILISVWIVAYLLVFSLASTKLPNYVIPSYPAFAIIIGRYIASWCDQPAASDMRWQLIGWACLVLIGAGVAIVPMCLMSTEAVAWLADRYQLDPSTLGSVRWIGWLGIPLVVGGAIGWAMRISHYSEGLPVHFALMSVAMMLVFWQVLVPIADRHQTPQDIASALREVHRDPGSSPSIAVLEYFRPSMVFYSRNPIDFFTNPNSLSQRLRDEPPSVIVLKERSLEAVRPDLPEGYRITQSYSEFPRRGRILILEAPHGGRSGVETR
jgi:4-amino-4-deoxy-L-arabinose transferase-like glycosyltransferase